MLAVVARLTGYYKVRWVIRAATRERYYMVYLVFCQLLLAIVASTALSLKLYLNILRSVFASGFSLARGAGMIGDSHFLRMSFMVETIIGSALFSMDIGILKHFSIILLSVPCLTSVIYLLAAFCACSVVLTASFIDSFSMTLPILAVRGSSTLRIGVPICASFLSIPFTMGVIPCAVSRFHALFTLRRIYIEVVNSGGVFVAAFCATFLGYNVAHGKAHSLSSRRGMLSASLRQNHFPHYTTNPRGRLDYALAS